MSDFFVLAAIFAAFAYVAALAHAVIGSTDQCRRLKRELDQAIADAEKRIHDRDNREKDRL